MLEKAIGDRKLVGAALMVSHRGWRVLVDPAPTATPQSPGSWLWGGVYGNSWFVDPHRELSTVLLTNTAVAGMIVELPDAIRDAIYRGLDATSS